MLSTNYLLTNCTYKQDLALNNPQGLICHKTTKPNQLAHIADVTILKPIDKLKC